jgi:AcrR family transcriptional regulator
MSNRDSTLAAILAAAEKLFVEKNYADVSMRDIAHAARVSTGALYHHFPGKERLYYAMLTAYLSHVKQATLAATPPTGACRERLRALTRAFLDLRPARRKVMRLVRRDLGVFNGRMRDGLVRAYQQAVPDLVEQVLQEAMKNGELEPQDPRWLAWAYVGIIETTLGDYARAHLGATEARLETALDLFLEGAAVRSRAPG